MIDKLLSSLVPLAIRQIAGLPMADKQAFAGFIAGLGYHFMHGDRVAFDSLLATISISANWKESLIEALWTDDHQG
jgi:hypothetical protein